MGLVRIDRCAKFPSGRQIWDADGVEPPASALPLSLLYYEYYRKIG